MTVLVTATAHQNFAPNSTVIAAVIMGAASILGVAITGWYTYRSAQRSAKATRDVEKEKVSTTSWQAQVDSWRNDVVTLRQQRAEDLAAFNQKLQECQVEIDELTSKFEAINIKHEQDRREHREQRLALERRIDAMVRWGREVVVIMRQRGIAFPAPPPGVSDTDPNGFEAVRSISPN